MNNVWPAKIKYALTFLFINVLYAHVFSQQTPVANAILNQTTVYFEERFVPGAYEYELTLFADSVTMNSGSALQKITNKIPAFVLKGLSWGTTYFWRVNAYSKDKGLLARGESNTFSILKIKHQGYDEVKMDVNTDLEEKHNKGLICVDYTKSIYDRKGNPVWTMPIIPGVVDENAQIRDLKVTKDNTITFITVFCVAEIDFYGNVLWKAPVRFTLNSDTIMYHHDFRKTNRGTYMVLGNRRVNRRVIGAYDDEVLKKEFGIKIINNELYKNIMIGILLEFNREGKLIWYWDANEYVTDADLNYKKSRTGFPNFLTHDNGFGENEEGTKVYVSFRDLSRIVKIDKKTKKVELTYGERYPSGDAVHANYLFKNQHDANVTNHNSIYIFNNNGSWAGGISSVIELKDNLKSKKDTPCVWKFDLDFDTLTKGKSLNGGKVTELPNTNLLVCAGELNRIFEVTKTKKIVWDAFLWGKTKGDSVWVRMPQYRGNWVKDVYQYHFIAQILNNKTGNSKKGMEISIYNVGNIEDAYEIEVFSVNNTLLGSTKTKTLAINKSTIEMLKLNTSIGAETPNYLIIKSKNGRLAKQLLIK